MTSLEATVLNGDSVAVATLVEYTISPDAMTIIDATFSVNETLKGDVPKTLKIPIHRAFRAFHGWVEGSSQMLLIEREEVYSATRLSVPDLRILRSDFTVLRDSESVVSAVKEICLGSPGVTGVVTVRISVPQELHEEFSITGMGTFLDVTIDERLERWAVAQSKSNSSVRRSEAATVLRYFKSEKNIAILKSMLDDPAHGDSVRPNGNLGQGRRKYSVRQAAYDALTSMLVYVDKPVVEEEYFDPDAVTFVYLRQPVTVGEFIEQFAQFENLTDVYFSGTRTTDADVKVLAALPGLNQLHLDHTAITDTALADIGRMTDLTYLNLAGTNITDAGLSDLTGLESLEYLDLGRTAITDAGLKEVAKLKSLRTLSLSNTKVTIRGLLALKPLKHLGKLIPSQNRWDLPDDYFSVLAEAGLLRAYERVYAEGDDRAYSDEEVLNASLYSVPITDAGLRELAAFKNLQGLGLPKTKVTDEGMKTVAGFKHLTSLILNDTQVTDVGVRALSGMQKIESLALANIRLTDDGLSALADLSKLQWLVLAGTQVTDDGLATLRGFKSLRHLIIGNTQISDAGILHLLELPVLENVSLYGTLVTDVGLLNLAGIESLRKITVHRTPGITSEGLAKLRRLRPDIELHN